MRSARPTSTFTASTYRPTAAPTTFSCTSIPGTIIQPGGAHVQSIGDTGKDAYYAVALIDANRVKQTVYVVAEDGEPLTRPVAVQELDLSIAKRYSFIVQVSPNDPAGTRYF